MLSRKLALGTVQFGLDYGINNVSGRTSSSEIEKILDYAYANNIDMLDTAFAYGKSEVEIGNYMRLKGNKFKVISKLPECAFEDVNKTFQLTLERLNTNEVYGYLLHSFQYFTRNPKVWDVLEEYKFKGKIKKIGFSLYYPSELEELLNREIKVDIIQVPYNILDQRFEQYFDNLYSAKIEIHTRSVFLQGLLLKKISELNKCFSPIKEKLIDLNEISISRNIPLYDICLNFVGLNDKISKIVVGVDNSSQLIKLVSSNKNMKEVEKIYSRLHNLQEKNEEIIIPYKWKLD
jgi:aryl-alcohol dehydrogenase-like predicted oxidoreductase